MSPFRKTAIGAALVASTLTGGAIGAALFAGSASNAATTSTTTPSSSSGSSSSGAPAYGGATGTFHSNENPAHEAGESAQREAQENAGQFPTVP
jgi:hypothetical protein